MTLINNSVKSATPTLIGRIGSSRIILGVAFVIVVIVYAYQCLQFSMPKNTNRKFDVDKLTLDRVPSLWSPTDFECVGWRAMSDCNPIHGHREQSLDRSCNTTIKAGMAGYCEVRNRSSGVIYRVMSTACHGHDIGFTCNMAQNFTDFSIAAKKYVHDPAPVVGTGKSRGIVFSIYSKVIPSVFAIVELLRSYGCDLPIELFYRPEEINPQTNSILQRLVITERVELRPVLNPDATRFRTKPYAIYHSRFDQVLFLDCDNIPLRDPTYLFELLNATTSAVFWPDYWHPKNTLFEITPESLLWEYLDIPYKNSFEQESGQLLIDRSQSIAALHRLMAYTFSPTTTVNLLEKLDLVYGDKDLFRLAYMATNTSFYFVSTPPVIAGTQLSRRVQFCGLAMCQVDHEGSLVFLHRNSLKISGDASQIPVISHIQHFDSDYSLEYYRVGWTGNFITGEACWGLPWPLSPSNIQTLPPSHPIVQAERKILTFAISAGLLLDGVQQFPILNNSATYNTWAMGGLLCSIILGILWRKAHDQTSLKLPIILAAKIKRKTSSFALDP